MKKKRVFRIPLGLYVVLGVALLAVLTVVFHIMFDNAIATLIFGIVYYLGLIIFGYTHIIVVKKDKK